MSISKKGKIIRCDSTATTKAITRFTVDSNNDPFFVWYPFFMAVALVPSRVVPSKDHRG
jgi:hypothetical protein